jgi:two-component system, NarL family, sensor histidine kinase UhpB
MLLAVAEREQERLGRELHDGVGQELAGAAFLAKALARRLDTASNPLAADAEWIKDVLKNSVESVRSLSRQLSPTELERGEILASLERLCADVERSYGIECRFKASVQVEAACASMSANSARQFYRITQEAINNSTRHGGCHRIAVSLAQRGKHLRLAIVDDGSGFPRETALAKAAGIGLPSMRLRAEGLGGDIRFTRRGGYTLVILRAPLP